MNRLEALKMTAFLLGSTVIGSQTFLAGCRSKPQNAGIIPDEEIPLLDEVGETILPATDQSPGAKAAEIGRFMNVIVTDCYTRSEQKIFINGLQKLRKRSREQYSKDFLDLTGEERFRLLAGLDAEAAAHRESDSPEPHYFSLIKQLTLWGYFSSEPGCTQALRYVQTPGRHEGCIPYREGDKAWAMG